MGGYNREHKIEHIVREVSILCIRFCVSDGRTGEGGGWKELCTEARHEAHDFVMILKLTTRLYYVTDGIIAESPYESSPASWLTRCRLHTCPLCTCLFCHSYVHTPDLWPSGAADERRQRGAGDAAAGGLTLNTNTSNHDSNSNYNTTTNNNDSNNNNTTTTTTATTTNNDDDTTTTTNSNNHHNHDDPMRRSCWWADATLRTCIV